jgi:hypothetical protein
MGSMLVVLVDPGSHVRASIGKVLVKASMGPSSDGGLYESFCFPGGSGSADGGCVLRPAADRRVRRDERKSRVHYQSSRDVMAEPSEVGQT